MYSKKHLCLLIPISKTITLNPLPSFKEDKLIIVINIKLMHNFPICTNAYNIDGKLSPGN